MKLRLLPVLISIIVSSAVLFGGWFLYDSVAMQNPLMDIIEQTEGVQTVELDIQNDVVIVKLQIEPEASLRQIHEKIKTDGASILGNREIKLEVTDNTSPAIEKWWSLALFDIAEAMDSKQYSNIPATLTKHAGAYTGLQASSEMDNENVYIKLSDGTNNKYIVLPRTPAQIGVWPNE